jgi:hypothetical protein
MDRKVVKQIADKEVKVHEKKMHGMKKGGVTSMAMKSMGRNLARAANQRGSSRGK